MMLSLLLTNDNLIITTMFNAHNKNKQDFTTVLTAIDVRSKLFGGRILFDTLKKSQDVFTFRQYISTNLVLQEKPLLSIIF